MGVRKSPEEYVRICMDDDGYIEPQVTSNEIYPSYIQQEVKETVETVQSLQNFNTVSFGFLTDSHYAARFNMTYTVRLRRTINAYREIAKRVSLDLLAMGGDHVNDGDKQYKSDCYRALRAELNGINYFPVNGNHDDSSIWDISFVPSQVSENHLEPRDRYVLFYNHLPALNAVFDDDNKKGLYYYYDNPAAKLRYIFLNTDDVPYIKDNGKLRYYPQGDYAVSQEQLKWLTEKALHFTESGWSVAVIAHVPPVPLKENREKIDHVDAIHTVLKCYKNGEPCEIHKGQPDFQQDISIDFSAEENRADIVGVFLGHTHVDLADFVDGIHYMTTGCSIMYVGGPSYIPRKDGDKSELLFDIITINKDTRTVSVTRVGAGDDRTYQY